MRPFLRFPISLDESVVGGGYVNGVANPFEGFGKEIHSLPRWLNVMCISGKLYYWLGWGIISGFFIGSGLGIAGIMIGGASGFGLAAFFRTFGGLAVAGTFGFIGGFLGDATVQLVDNGFDLTSINWSSAALAGLISGTLSMFAAPFAAIGVAAEGMLSQGAIAILGVTIELASTLANFVIWGVTQIIEWIVDLINRRSRTNETVV